MTTTAKLHLGYVLTPAGTIAVQIPEPNQWGFSLYLDDQSFPGGIGLASEWIALADDDERISDDDRDALGWMLDNARAEA